MCCAEPIRDFSEALRYTETFRLLGALSLRGDGSELGLWFSGKGSAQVGWVERRQERSECAERPPVLQSLVPVSMRPGCTLFLSLDPRHLCVLAATPSFP